MPIDHTESGVTITIPITVRQYNIGHTLGRGPNSVVKIATSNIDDKKYALKFMLMSDITSKNIDSSIFSMIKSIQSYSNSSILKIFDTFEIEENSEKILVIVTEYCAKGTLLNVISNNNKLTEEYAKVLFTKIIDGILYLHGLKIVHRQLSLNSILVTENDDIKIANFGYSHKLVQHQLLTTQCGTPIFAAPEVIKNKPYDGQKADMWSLGVILYTMVVGKMPWNSLNNPIEVMNQIVRGTYTIPSDISINLNDLISSLIVVPPEFRISCSDILSHPWITNEQSDSRKVHTKSHHTNDSRGSVLLRATPRILAPNRKRVVSRSTTIKSLPFL